jgi:hypothetical protein
MSTVPTDDEKNLNVEADEQADAMKDQLRKDVASWSAGRSEESALKATEVSVQMAKPAAQLVKRVKRAKPAATDVKPAATGKKPFSMSYDGVTEADYITYMIARGAR